MGLYVFKNPDTGEVKEVFQHMSEDHVYEEKEGEQWERVFTIPTASIDTKVDPFSNKEYVEKTSNKNFTIGDLQDHSHELSEKRKHQVGGTDPVKQKFFDKYSDARNGKRHQQDPRPQPKKKLKDLLKRKDG